MPNVNTITDVVYSQNNGQPIVLPFPTTGHAAFSLGAGVALASIANPMALVEANKTFPNRSAQALPFVIRACGTMSLGGQVRYQIDINQGTGLTPAIISTGLITGGAGPYNDNWLLEAECLWDATSTQLRGIYYGFAGPNSVAQSAIVSSTPAALANLQFNCAVTVTNANAANTFSLTSFTIELV